MCFRMKLETLTAILRVHHVCVCVCVQCAVLTVRQSVADESLPAAMNHTPQP